MLASSQTVTAKPAGLPPPAPPALPGNPSAGGPSFAQLLNDQPAPSLPPAHADAAPRLPDAHAPASPPAAASSPAARCQAAATPAKPSTAARSNTPDATTPAAKTDTPAVADDAGADDGDMAVNASDSTEPTDAADTPETAGLDEFTQLIGLAAPVTPPATPALATTGALPLPASTPATLPATGQAEAAAALAAAATAAAPAPGAAHAARAGHAGPDEVADLDQPTAASAAAVDSRPAAERRPAEGPSREPATHAKLFEAGIATAEKAGPRNTDTRQTAPGTSSAGAPHPVGSPEAGTPNFAAVLAQPLPTPGVAAATAPVAASGQVNAALHSSGFAPELAASISLLAVDGVQQAELQLNPADMGPVAVQIVVDGTQAEVSFHAAQAETRQALEQSLPDLAAALQGQGLTLSGGGVFQQAPRDADHDRRRADGGGSAPASRGGSDRIGGTAARATMPVRRSVGLLDTFA